MSSVIIQSGPRAGQLGLGPQVLDIRLFNIILVYLPNFKSIFSDADNEIRLFTVEPAGPIQSCKWA